MNVATTIQAAEELKPDLLTETIVSKLANPVTNSDFDFHGTVNDVLKDVGLSTADSGGKLSFNGGLAKQDMQNGAGGTDEY